MASLQNEVGDTFAKEMTQFALSITAAAAGCFIWIENEVEAQMAAAINISDKYVGDYGILSTCSDPFLIAPATIGRRRIVGLNINSSYLGGDVEVYRKFLSDHGYSDELNLYFFEAGRLHAILALLQISGKSFDFPIDGFAPLHRYLEYSTGMHPRSRLARQEAHLRKAGLTEREIDVVRLIGNGRTNAEIAQILRIRLPTVKTHVANILGKASVPNRTAIATFWLGLQSRHVDWIDDEAFLL